jgi:hypothetical protein
MIISRVVLADAGSDQNPAELIQQETLHSEIHKLIVLIWNEEELSHQWKESIVVPIHKKGGRALVPGKGPPVPIRQVAG